ncbi:hypothetical protein B0H10DRAFT_1947203 [Mycena sp. CBHHK59/15]|nr:hypothetical protein B0H10DRAFT_1947203 [Mycena sp. CBHHK59/15]
MTFVNTSVNNKGVITQGTTLVSGEFTALVNTKSTEIAVPVDQATWCSVYNQWIPTTGSVAVVRFRTAPEPNPRTSELAFHMVKQGSNKYPFLIQLYTMNSHPIGPIAKFQEPTSVSGKITGAVRGSENFGKNCTQPNPGNTNRWGYPHLPQRQQIEVVHDYQ